jgi:anti-anti-sigma factor
MHPSVTAANYVAASDILSTNAEGIRADLGRITAQASDNSILTIDLRACRLVDSVGLNLIVSTIKQCRTRGIKIRLLVAHPNLHRILTFTRLGQYADIVRESAGA